MNPAIRPFGVPRDDVPATRCRVPARRAAALLGALLVGLALPAGPAHAQAGQPNVIVLMADDLGYGDLGSYDSPDAETPFLDDLAARGLRFTDFYAGGPVCTPSRYALLTGLHTFRAGDDDLLKALLWNNTTSGIEDGVVTLGEALQAEGYETALMGKWHLGQGQMLTSGASDTEYHPLYHGFDSFYGPLGGVIDYNTHRNVAANVVDWWDDRRRATEDNLLYATHLFGQHAAAFIDDHPGAGTAEPPFFLYLPVTAPHYGDVDTSDRLLQLQLPIGEEEEYLSRFDDQYPNDNTLRKRFLAMVAVLDDEVGRIVDALERNGLMDDTVIWFLSDNGAATRYGGSNGGFRGKKGDPYEGGVRVPSFVVWEGHIARRTSDQIAGNVDVFPTVLALAGAPLPAPVDGLDLSDFVLGGPAVSRGVAVPNSEYGDAYRLRRWKYVKRYEGNPPAELYDLDADPDESRDLASVYPDTLALLASLMPYGTDPGGDRLSLIAGTDDPTVPRGTRLDYTVELENQTAQALTFDLHLLAVGPGITLDRGLTTNTTLDPHDTATLSFRLRIPSSASLGAYTATVSALDDGGGTLASGTFTFQVVASSALAAGGGAGSSAAAGEETGWGVELLSAEGLRFSETSSAGETPSAPAQAAFPPSPAALTATPNPARGRATFTFTLAEPTEVRLAVYDVLGREVALLMDGTRAAGTHGAPFDAASLPRGTYLVRLEAGGAGATQRITLVR